MMTWWAARVVAWGGRRVRRQGWRDRWLRYAARKGLWLVVPVNPVTLVEGVERVALASDFTEEDMRAGDFTTAPMPIPEGGALATVTLTEIMGPGLPDPAINDFGDFPPGDYRMVYVEGAHFFNLRSRNQLRVSGWRIRSGGTDLPYPLTTPAFSPAGQITDPAEEIALLAQLRDTYGGFEFVFAHAGGSIGMWLQDTPYTDNRPSAVLPQFSLFAAG